MLQTNYFYCHQNLSHNNNFLPPLLLNLRNCIIHATQHRPSTVEGAE
jgi:hypothetical protein